MSGKRNLKILILGEPAVGKTALMERFVNDNYSALYKPTIGADFLCKDLTLKSGQLVKLYIWDTAGEETWFYSLGASYYRGADACLLVYDMTNAKTLQQLDYWRNDFINHSYAQEISKFPFLVVGNMKDKTDQIQVNEQRGRSFAEQRGGNIGHYQVSAKTGDGVAAVFEEIATRACENYKVEDAGADQFLVDMGDDTSKYAPKKSCC